MVSQGCQDTIMYEVICINCKWWDKLSSDEDDKADDKNKCGQCHRNAPPARLCFEESLSDNLNSEDICCYEVGWPFTKFDDFCGEFKAKSTTWQELYMNSERC